MIRLFVNVSVVLIPVAVVFLACLPGWRDLQADRRRRAAQLRALDEILNRPRDSRFR